LDWLQRSVVSIASRFVDGSDDFHSSTNLSKNWVLGRGGLVPEIKKLVVDDVDEKLGSTGVGLSGVGHGQGAGLIRKLWAVWLPELVWNGTFSVSGDLSCSSFDDSGVLGAWGGSTSSRLTGSGISGVRASELVHEVGDYSVKMKTVVEAFIGEIDEIVCGNGHIIGIQLNGELPHGGIYVSEFVRHV